MSNIQTHTKAMIDNKFTIVYTLRISISRNAQGKKLAPDRSS